MQAQKPAIDTFGKADSPGLLRGDDILKNLPHLLFHGPAMVRGTQTQTVFDRFVEVSNSQAAHGFAPGDFNAIIEIISNEKGKKRTPPFFFQLQLGSATWFGHQ